MLISPLTPFFLGRNNQVTQLWLCMAWYCCNIFRVSLSIISNSVMIQSSTKNPCNSARMAYELIASKVCLLESSLFRIIFSRLKYSFLSDDLAVLSVVRISPNPKYLYYWFNSSDFSYSRLSSWMFYICPEAHSNIITKFIDDFNHWCKLIVACSKEFNSSMKKRCEIISPWWLILYPRLFLFNSQESWSNDRMKSNPDGLSPWKMAVSIEKSSVLVWPSWWLRCSYVFQFFIVFQ